MKKTMILVAIMVFMLTGCRPALIDQPADMPPAPGATGSGSDGGVKDSPEPRSLTITSSDGTELPATYYPAAVQPAPIIVLMHWYGGDQSDWIEIAPWLQNRGQGGRGNASLPWFDKSWFPAAPQGMSYAVLTFSFRGCGAGGCQGMSPSSWVEDAQAAMQTAAGMEGVDAQKMVAMGASIGADGAADGCLWVNQNLAGAHCAGALSFSAGSYLGLSYGQVIAGLNDTASPALAWCVYGNADSESAAVCKAVSGLNYTPLEYKSGNHGLNFFQPKVEPSMFEVMLDFLEQALK
jgi:hypothetical protein